MPNTFPFYDAEPYWPKGGYGHHGGGDDSGSAATTDFYIFVESFDTPAPLLEVLELDDMPHLESEPMTIDGADAPFCYHYKNCPVGAGIYNSVFTPALYYNDKLQPADNNISNMRQYPLYCPRPLDGLYIVGRFETGGPK
jgi:hypothetical protein